MGTVIQHACSSWPDMAEPKSPCASPVRKPLFVRVPTCLSASGVEDADPESPAGELLKNPHTGAAYSVESTLRDCRGGSVFLGRAVHAHAPRAELLVLKTVVAPARPSPSPAPQSMDDGPPGEDSDSGENSDTGELAATDANQRELLNEARMLGYLKDMFERRQRPRCFPAPVDYFHCAQSARVCLAMEYVRGKDLFDFVKEQCGAPFDERQVAALAAPLLDGLAEMHALGVAHRDISCENLLLLLDAQKRVQRLVLCDFGLSSFYTPPAPGLEPGLGLDAHFEENRAFFSVSPLTRQTAGKPGYCSPELLQGCANPFAADVYALGVALFVMLTGRPPCAPTLCWKQLQRDRWFNVLWSGAWLSDPQMLANANARACYGHLSARALDVLDRIFKPERARPTVAELRQHPFFRVRRASAKGR